MPFTLDPLTELLETPEAMKQPPTDIAAYLNVNPASLVLEGNLASTILSNIKAHLLKEELGFHFVGHAQKLSLGEKSYSVDSAYYAEAQRAYVLIDLNCPLLDSLNGDSMIEALELLAENATKRGENSPIGIRLFANENNIKATILNHKGDAYTPGEEWTNLPSTQAFEELLEYILERWV